MRPPPSSVACPRVFLVRALAFFSPSGPPLCFPPSSVRCLHVPALRSCSWRLPCVLWSCIAPPRASGLPLPPLAARAPHAHPSRARMTARSRRVWERSEASVVRRRMTEAKTGSVL
eukprot:2561635-Rhodomonas_salina.1